MKSLFWIFSLLSLLCACSANEQASLEPSDPVSIDWHGNQFHGTLEYMDTSGTLRVRQQWSYGRQNGITKVFNSKGLLLFEDYCSDSMYKHVYGDQSYLSCHVMPQSLGEFYLHHAAIEFLDSISLSSPFQFRLLNVPEICLTVSVHGNALKKTHYGWEILPRHLKDTLKIDIRTYFDEGKTIEKKFRIPV